LEKFAFRIAIAAMLLMAGLPFFFGFGQDVFAHLVAGRPVGDILPKIGGLMFTAGLALLGGIILQRAVRGARIGRRGFEAPAKVIRTTRQDDGTWSVTYSYRDRGGEAHEGTFSTDADAWREGDAGRARFDPDAPARSTWMSEDAPAHEARPPPASPSSLGGTFARFLGLITGLAAIASGSFVYWFWIAIWRDGGATAYEPLQTAGVLALVFAFTMPFAFGTVGFVVFCGGLLVMGLFAVVRRALRN
jgi:hypothetical protein